GFGLRHFRRFRGRGRAWEGEHPAPETGQSEQRERDNSPGNEPAHFRIPSELAAPWAADQERYLSAPGSTNPLARALAEMSKGCSAHPARAAALFRRRLRGETAVFFQEGDDLVHS